jgi:FtsH-binding integral membrane protein
MKRVLPWLLPTLLAPLVGAWLYVFVVAQVVSLPIRIPTLAWLIAASVAGGLAFLVGCMMAATDVALLKLKLREPPTGWRALLMGVLSPLPVLFAWQKLVKFAITGWPQLLLTFFLPMLAVALVSRLVLGTRPDSWKK